MSDPVEWTKGQEAAMARQGFSMEMQRQASMGISTGAMKQAVAELFRFSTPPEEREKIRQDSRHAMFGDPHPDDCWCKACRQGSGQCPHNNIRIVPGAEMWACSCGAVVSFEAIEDEGFNPLSAMSARAKLRKETG